MTPKTFKSTAVGEAKGSPETNSDMLWTAGVRAVTGRVLLFIFFYFFLTVLGNLGTIAGSHHHPIGDRDGRPVGVLVIKSAYLA